MIILGDNFGRIGNIRFEESGNDLALHWTHIEKPDDPDAQYIIYIDSEPTVIVPANQTMAFLPRFADAKISVDIGYNTRFWVPPPCQTNLFGSKTRLTFSSDSQDLAGYKIYWDNGTGTVNYSTPIGEVTDVVLAKRQDVSPGGRGTPDSAFPPTHNKKVAFIGEYNGPPTNSANYYVVITNGVLSYYSPETESSVSGIQLQQGGVYPLFYGISLVCQDNPKDYLLDHFYTFFIGVKQSWISPEMTGGTSYKYAVKAYDYAGNVSDASSIITVAPYLMPLALTNKTLTKAYDENGAELSWTLPGGTIGAIRVYTNYNEVFKDLEELVIEENHIASLSSSATGYSFSPDEALTDEVMFYIRPRILIRELADVDMLSIDATDVTNYVALNNPENIRATAQANGYYKIEWDYSTTNGGDCEGFYVYIDDTLPLTTYTHYASSTIRSYQSMTPLAYGTYYVLVRSIAQGGDLLSPYLEEEIITINIDDDPPFDPVLSRGDIL